MFELQNRIIIVDDREDELDTLTKALLDNGIGCRPLLYDNTYNEPLTKIRIAFFDINIGEKKVDDSGKTVEEFEKLNSGVYNDLAVAINQYIAPQNGPFALIFWTKNKKIIDGFIKYMQNPQRGFSNSPFPIFIGCIDKDEFIIANNENSLSQKLLEVLNQEPIKFLFDFENKASIAGEKTINKIYDILPKDTNWGQTTILFENLGKVLSKIAASTLGFAHSKENPSKAVYEGLIPILNNELTSIESDVNWNKLLNPLFTAASHDKIVSPDDLIQRKVNSIFHIENSDGNKDVRGSVIEIDKTNSVILQSLNIGNINAWFNEIIPFNSDKDVTKTQTRNNSTLIALEISAACDYSNRKDRINKYILGFVTPCINVKDDIAKQRRIESSYHVGGTNFHFIDTDFQIWLNFNFVFGTKTDDNRLGDTMFVLKKEIMDMIGNKYASHISRIGITSF
jgi:hypothetical protein